MKLHIQTVVERLKLDESEEEQSITSSVKDDLNDFGYFLRDIFDDADDGNVAIIDSVTEKLANTKTLVSKSLEKLGRKKLAICQGSLAKFINTFKSLQNISSTEFSGLKGMENFKFDPKSYSRLQNAVEEASVVLKYMKGGALKDKLLGEEEIGDDIKGIFEDIYDLYDCIVDSSDDARESIRETFRKVIDENDIDDDLKEIIVGFILALYQSVSVIACEIANAGAYGTIAMSDDDTTTLPNSRKLTMAFLGGGALTTDVLGEPAMLLGESVSRPTIAVLGHLMGIQSDNELDFFKDDDKKTCEMKKEFCLFDIELALACQDVEKTMQVNTQVEKLNSFCKGIQKRADMFTSILDKLDKLLASSAVKFEAITELMGMDYQAYSPQAKQNLNALISVVQATQAMLETPLLNDKGALTNESRQIGESVEQFLRNAK